MIKYLLHLSLLILKAKFIHGLKELRERYIAEVIDIEELKHFYKSSGSGS